MIARASLVCSTARFCPMHVRTPTPKGMKARGWFAARATPWLKRPGLNSFASFPHMAWSWWTARIGTSSSVPRGILYPPNSTSVFARLIVAIVGGYSLSDSFTIMLTCTTPHPKHVIGGCWTGRCSQTDKARFLCIPFPFAYRPQLCDMVFGRKLTWSTHLQNLLTCPYLPLWMHS